MRSICCTRVTTVSFLLLQQVRQMLETRSSIRYLSMEVDGGILPALRVKEGRGRRRGKEGRGGEGAR